MERLKVEKDNTSLAGWVNGQYIAKAISANFSKKAKYPDTPFKLYEVFEETDEEVYEYTDADRFLAYALAFNNAHPDLKQLPAPTDT